MEINYKLTRQEWLDFHIKHITETKIYKKKVFIWCIECFLLLLVEIILTKNFYISLAFTLIFILMSYLFIRRIFFKYFLEKSFSERYYFEKFNSYFSSIKLTLNNDYLELITELDEKHYKWKTIKNIYLVDNYIFIRTSSHDDLLIPINAFESSEIKTYFLDTIIKSTNLKLENKYPTDIKYQ